MFGKGICYTATFWVNVKSTVFDRVPVLHYYGLLSGNKRGRTRIVRLGEGTWIVRLGEGTWIVGLLRYENLDSRVVKKKPG